MLMSKDHQSEPWQLKQLHLFQIPVSASEVAPAVSICVPTKQLCMNMHVETASYIFQSNPLSL